MNNSVEQYIIDLFNHGLSPYEIAEKLPNFNHMKVRRTLAKLGIKGRDKSAAQKTALKSGRAKHPKKKVSADTDIIYNNVEDKDGEICSTNER